MRARKILGPRVDLPSLGARCPVERNVPTSQVAEVDGVIGDEGGSHDAGQRGLKAGHALLRIARERLGRWLSGPAVRPADLAVGRQLVESRVGGRSEVDV